MVTVLVLVLLEMMTKVLLFITRTSGGKARVRMTPLPPRSSKLRLSGTCKQRRKVRPCWRRERLLAIIIHSVETVTLTAVVRMWMELLHPLQHDPRRIRPQRVQQARRQRRWRPQISCAISVRYILRVREPRQPQTGTVVLLLAVEVRP